MTQNFTTKLYKSCKFITYLVQMYHVSELSYSHVLTEDFIAIFHNNTRYNLSQHKIAIFLYLQLLTEESPFIYMSSPRTSYLAVFPFSGLVWGVLGLCESILYM